jgi:hypothetical protein
MFCYLILIFFYSVNEKDVLSYYMKMIESQTPQIFLGYLFPSTNWNSSLVHVSIINPIDLHSYLDSQNIHFPRVTSRKVFYPQVRCSIQMLYENAEATRLLGNTPVLRATYYTPSTHRTYDFGDILIKDKHGIRKEI